MRYFVLVIASFCLFACQKKNAPLTAQEQELVEKRAYIAKQSLKIIYTLQESYQLDNNTYANDLKTIEFKPNIADSNEYNCTASKDAFLCKANLNVEGRNIYITIDQGRQMVDHKE